jgi:hypothetical protein
MFEALPPPSDLLGLIRQQVEELRAAPLAELPDALVEEEFAALWRVAELVELEKLRRLADLDRRQVFARDGHVSVASWLAVRFGVAHGEARGAARLARELDVMPATSAAVHAGDVSLSKARVLADARRTDVEAFERSEPTLVGAATRHGVRDLQTAVTFWIQRVHEQRGSDPDEVLRERRGLHVSRTYGGMIRLDADLDPDTGEPVLTAIGAVVDAGVRADREDPRSPAQRRADALSEICRQWLDRKDRPAVAGERPHVTVTIALDDLRAPTGATASLDHAGTVTAQIARRLACDGSVRRVVLNGRSQVLDVGRATPVVPAALRRGVIVRDRRCRFPGCDRPHPWCDAHHIHHWADGGSTALDNLVLLCRHHHGSIHRRHGFGVRMVAGHLEFRRPDGSLLVEDRAPP